MDEHYAFGKNWTEFLTKFSPECLEAAQRCLLQLVRLPSFEGKRFLDIGSGSGLHSLVAWHAGAQHIVSFDYDPDAVSATRSLWEMAGKPEHWHILQGSVLDADFMRSHGLFDIVYAWGVLHHTGDARQAIRNSRIPLADNGVLCLALYSETHYRDASLYGRPTLEQLLAVKQEYNAAGICKKRLMEYAFVWRPRLRRYGLTPLGLFRACSHLRSLQREYVKDRGMDFWTDVRDWLGGWPMEFLKEGDVLRLCHTELGLDPLDVIVGKGNTEYIFRPSGSANYWDAILARRRRQAFSGPFQRIGEGNMWARAMPKLAYCADTKEHPSRSPLVLLEDGLPLGYAHAQHLGIQTFGEGRYSHWGHLLYFSTSDNTDPNSNGRVYTAELPIIRNSRVTE